MSTITHEQACRYLHNGPNRLKTAEHAALDRHLTECDACRSYADQLALLQPALSRALRLRHFNRYSFSAETLQHIQQQSRRAIMQKQILTTIGVLAGIVALVLVAQFFTRSTGIQSSSPASATVTASPPAPTPLATSSADRFEPNNDFEHATPIELDVKYDNLNFVESTPSENTWDGDYLKVQVKQGLHVTCHTFNLSHGTDTNLLLYDQNRNGLDGNDNVNLAAGDLSSSVIYSTTYDGWLYLLIGEGVHRSPEEAARTTYSLECTTQIVFPEIERRPELADFYRGSLTSVPTYTATSTDTWQMDLRSYNLAKFDLSHSLNDLLYADFDSQTRWPPPAKMPAGFDWRQIMELGKNPGLGIRSLHTQGITGHGVGLAIIDQPLPIDHQEYADRLRLYEEINISPTTGSQMHGPAVASIAAGKTVGVAPEADLYYIGTWPGDFGTGGPDNFTYNFHYIAQGIRRLLEINQQLPKERMIRVISISVGWRPEDKGYAEVMAAVNAAKAAGVLVVSSSLQETFGFKFDGLGRAPLADPDKFESYEPGLWWAKDFYADPKNRFFDRLLVPMDSRTTASPTGNNEYVFYREGGWSWSIPYIAGVYALAAQVKPSITPDEFWALALKTGQTIQLKHESETISFGPILDPVALVTALQTK